MKNYFDITEFMIDPDMQKPEGQIPVHVVQKLDKYHRPILNEIREELGCPVIISKHSGYRPVEWELERGRSGDSQHTFKHKGAVDVTCKKMRFYNLLKLLKDSDYRRVAYYVANMFVHCDFKGHEKLYYEVDETGTWKLKGNR